jgi:hypothetical protein
VPILPATAAFSRSSSTHLAESILAEVDYVGGVGSVVLAKGVVEVRVFVNRPVAILNFEHTEFRRRTDHSILAQPEVTCR